MPRPYLLIALLFALWPIAAQAQSRHALVIGIDNYVNFREPLERAVADARAVGSVLEQAGFDVHLGIDLDRGGMIELMGSFLDALSAGDHAFVFYAGHAVEIERRNYLIPADARNISQSAEAIVIAESLAQDFLLEQIQGRDVAITVVVLDACRDNPFEGLRTRSGATRGGLAIETPPEGVFLLFSADEGQEALDGLGPDDPHPNSIFTRTLLPLLAEPGLDIVDVARRLRGPVQQLAASIGHTQFPAYRDRMRGDGAFYVIPPRTAVPAEPAAAPDPCTAALPVWSAIRGQGSAEALRDFISEYAACATLASLARQELARIDAGQPAAVPATAPEWPCDEDAQACARALATADPGDAAEADALIARVVASPAAHDALPGLFAAAVAQGLSTETARALQRLLTREGDYDGAIDGSAGAQTRAALDAWSARLARQRIQAENAQAHAGLIADWGRVRLRSLGALPDARNLFVDCIIPREDYVVILGSRALNALGSDNFVSLTPSNNHARSLTLAEQQISYLPYCPTSQREPQRVASFQRFAYPSPMPDSARIVRAHVNVWDIATGRRVAEHATRLDTLLGVALSPDGAHFVAWHDDQETIFAELWAVGSTQPRLTWSVPSQLGFEPVFTSDSRRFATIEGPEIVIRTSHQGQLWRRIRPAADVMQASLADLHWVDNDQALLWSQITGHSLDDRRAIGRLHLQLWDVGRTGRLVAEFTDADTPYGHDAQNGMAMMLAPDRSTAITVSPETGVHVWSIRDRQRVAHYPLEPGTMLWGLSPDGTVLLAEIDGDFRLLEPLTGTLIADLPDPRLAGPETPGGFSEFLYQAEFTRDGRAIIAVSSRESTFIWERAW